MVAGAGKMLWMPTASFLSESPPQPPPSGESVPATTTRLNLTS